MLKYFNEIHTKNHMVYSCDMLRLAFRTPKYFTATLTKHLEQFKYTLENNIDIDVYYSSRIGRYQYLLNYDAGDNGNFTVGFPFNDFQWSDSSHGFIEFNPNKCNCDIIQYFLNIIATFSVNPHGKIFEVKRFDLAIDIPVERSGVVLLKKGNRVYNRMVSDSITEYLGTRGAHGSCKLYDKQKEAGLDFPLTRLEITFTDTETFQFPDVYIFDDFEDDADMDALNSTDKVIVRLLRNLPCEEQEHYFRQLGRCKKKKLDVYIYPRTKEFKIDPLAVMDVVDNVKAYQFNNDGWQQLKYSSHRQKIREYELEAEFYRSAAREPFDDFWYLPSYESTAYGNLKESEEKACV